MKHRSSIRRTLAALTLFALTAPFVRTEAQNPTPAAPPAPTGPAVGEMAPDFTLPGATRYGRLRDPINLSSYRGSTVVLAFFVKARTRG
jgi:hypothetical protein